jgi:dimethylaniline monooxygenase (N-oxide forming)
MSQWNLKKLIELLAGKLPPELQPEHDILGANPVIHSSFLEIVNVGRIIPHRDGVQEITPTGLSLTNGETVEVDAIILCTGYDIDYPFIPEDCYRSKHSKFMDSTNSVNLYRLTVPPHHPNLFIMGIFQLPGPIQPAAELQARWASGILAGNITLPSPEQMSDAIASSEERRAKLVRSFYHRGFPPFTNITQWVKSDRHTVSDHFLPYCDELANDIGVAPTFGRLFCQIFTSNPLRAISLLNAVYFGVVSSAQYRLFGHGREPYLAAATILRLSKSRQELSEDEKRSLRATAVSSGHTMADAKPEAVCP